MENEPQLPQIPKFEGADNAIRWYIDTLKATLFHPVAFFRKLPVSGGYTIPLVFGLVTHWIGVAFRSMWLSASGEQINRLLLGAFRWGASENPFGWMMGIGSVIIDPFFTLFSVFFSAALIYLAARILVPAQRPEGSPTVTLESATRVVCYGMAGTIFQAVPFMGPVISAIWVGITTFFAAREVYRVSTGRAAVIILFPQILFLLFVGAIVGLLVLFAFKMAGVVFS